MASMPSATAAAHASRMTASYCWFEQGHGTGTSISGSPAAAACARITEARVPCIATRSKALLTVVSKPTTSYVPCCRSVCRVQALSFPLLQDTNVRTPIAALCQRLLEIADQVFDIL